MPDKDFLHRHPEFEALIRIVANQLGIDIHIPPPAGLELKTGKNHDKPQHVQGRKDYYDALAGEIAIDDIRAERDTAFDDERYYRSGGVRLIYRSHFDIGMTEAKEGVLLEL